MKVFKEIIGIIVRTFGTFFFGLGVERMICGDYKTATYLLFVASVLFTTGYFTERWINM